jgi:GNAT superfamily N-acetyltransferase
MNKTISEEETIAAIENNLYHLWSKAASLSGGQLCVNNEFCYARTNMGWPNNIFNCHIKDEDIETTIGEIAAEMRKGNYPGTWTVGPKSTPHNLGEYLIKGGFRKSRQQCGMAVELNSMNTSIPQDDKLEIEIIKNKDDIESWTAVTNTCFGRNTGYQVFQELLLDSDVTFYAGIINGEIVATLLLYYAAGVAGVNSVTTLPIYRGRGIAASMTVRALTDAYKKGYQLGILQASPMGEPVYQKIGFKKFFMLDHYKLDLECK